MEEKGKRQQIIVRICCIIAAFGLWLYITNIENPLKESKITVPVEIINKDVLSDSNLALADEEQPTVTLAINGDAMEVFAAKPSQFKLQADLKEFALKKGENSIPVTIKEQPDKIKVTNEQKLYIKLNIDELVEKKVPVKVLTEGKAKEGYFPLQPKVGIQEAVVVGPSTYMGAVSAVQGKMDITNLTKDVTSNIALSAVDSSGKVVSSTKVKPAAVEVTLPIRKVKSVGISVATKGTLSNNIVLKNFTTVPDKIDIAGSEKDLEKISELETEPIDLGKFNGSDAVDAKLVVPSGISLVSSNGYVKVKLNGEKVSQKTFKINVQLKGLKEGFEGILEQPQVNVVVSAADSILNNLKQSDMTCTIDVTNQGEGDYNLPPNVTIPDNVTKVSVDPATVKIKIKKKQ